MAKFKSWSWPYPDQPDRFCRAWSIVNILSRQNILKTTSELLFDDVIVTSLHLSAIHYNQKIEHTPMINCWKFHQVRIKTKKVMEGGGRRIPPPLGWETSKKLGLRGYYGMFQTVAVILKYILHKCIPISSVRKRWIDLLIVTGPKTKMFCLLGVKFLLVPSACVTWRYNYNLQYMKYALVYLRTGE